MTHRPRNVSSRFQSARPVKGATRALRLLRDLLQFQSARPVKGATCRHPATVILDHVSIRAPREGRDSAYFRAKDDLLVVSIRAPREGRDGRSAMPFCLNYLTSERCEPVDLEASLSLFLKARMSKNLWANDFRDSRTYR